MVPFEDGLDGVTEFLLVPYFGTCIHTPPPPPNQMVYVQMAPGRTVASIPGSGDVSFVDESDPGQPTLRRWRVNRGEDEEVAALPDPESMHAWFSPYTVFLLHEGILYRSTGDPGRPWHPMLTELDELVGRASAFAVSPGTLRIAVVVGLERR